MGVIGAIVPWNYPLLMTTWKLGPALATGNSVVLKPSEKASLTALRLAELAVEAGLPQGVFNVVPGYGHEAGEALALHMEVDAVGFTGSTRVGRKMLEYAGRSNLKRVYNELGGKSANLVLQDADLAAAAKWNVTRAFTNSGQSCHAPSRILVHQSQHEELLRLLLEEVKHVRLGDPKDPKTTMGPVINKAQYERIQRYIQIGLDEGASLAVGGLGRPGGLEQGYYIRPTVFSNVRPGMTIEQEEIFGPVLVVLSYATEEEAIRIANGTPYGLGAYVFAGDLRKGYEVGSQLRAGRVFLNGVPSNTAAPMGGYRHSGNGREMGRFGLEEYLEVKAMFGFPEPLGF
jgi:aldehyde dehydrogenase (NAD+)